MCVHRRLKAAGEAEPHRGSKEMFHLEVNPAQQIETWWFNIQNAPLCHASSSEMMSIF